MEIHDFDRATVNVSIGLAKNLIMNRIIGNIRVSTTKKGYETIRSKSHQSIKPELLTRKWGMCLEKSKETLKEKNKDYICSDLLILTRRYCIYLISQQLSRFSCTFYMDTLFENHKSIIGNTCDHINGRGRILFFNP